MYAQSFFVSSVRGSGFAPTTSESAASGVTGRMKAALGFRLLAAFFAMSAPSQGARKGRRALKRGELCAGRCARGPGGGGGRGPPGDGAGGGGRAGAEPRAAPTAPLAAV